MGGLFSNSSAKAAPTPKLVPEATTVSSADTSDSDTVIARLMEQNKKRSGYTGTMKTGGDYLASSTGTDKKNKLGA